MGEITITIPSAVITAFLSVGIVIAIGRFVIRPPIDRWIDRWIDRQIERSGERDGNREG